MGWVWLAFAGLCEVVWALGLKYTDGFTRVVPSVITVVGMIASVVALGLALKTLPLGVAYAVWTGIGTIGAVIGAAILLGEPLSAVKVLCIGLILSGIVGLKLTTAV